MNKIDFHLIKDRALIMKFIIRKWNKQIKILLNNIMPNWQLVIKVQSCQPTQTWERALSILTLNKNKKIAMEIKSFQCSIQDVIKIKIWTKVNIEINPTKQILKEIILLLTKMSWFFNWERTEWMNIFKRKPSNA
jgi:hypothetical protein